MTGFGFRPAPPMLPLLAAALLAALPAAQAAEPRPAPSTAAKGGFGNRSGALLSRAELRACLARQDRIRTLGDDAGRERAALDAEAAALKSGGEALKAEFAALDRTNEEAVRAYVAKGEARDRRIDALGAADAAYNARVRELQAEQAAFAAACGNRRYDEADERAIRAGR